MSSASSNPSRDTAGGLPPVTPPSGRFIAQLFLVPGLIVALAILLLMMFRFLIGEGYTSQSFLKQLDSDNADIRWRGASDLAQVLKRPESVDLKTDPAFALDLTARLRTALDDLYRREIEIQPTLTQLTQENREKAWLTLSPLRYNVTFLAAALGEFDLPVAVPLLGEIILHDQSLDVQGWTQLRRQTTWSLANLGNNVKEFAKLPAARRDATIAALVKEAGGPLDERATRARTALYYLDKSKLATGGEAGMTRADEILAKAAYSEDRLIREMVALGLAFWEGPLVEPTLLRLSRDKGQGTLIHVKELE